MKKLIAFVIIAMLCGCAGANISSQIRESGEQGSSKMIRCIDLSTGNLAADSKTVLKKGSVFVFVGPENKVPDPPDYVSINITIHIN